MWIFMLIEMHYFIEKEEVDLRYFYGLSVEIDDNDAFEISNNVAKNYIYICAKANAESTLRILDEHGVIVYEIIIIAENII